MVLLLVFALLTNILLIYVLRQAVMSLSDGSGLCFTVSEHFSPSGR